MGREDSEKSDGNRPAARRFAEPVEGVNLTV